MAGCQTVNLGPDETPNY